MNLRCVKGCKVEPKCDSYPVLSEWYMNMNNPQLQKEWLLCASRRRETPGMSSKCGCRMVPLSWPHGHAGWWHGAEILPRWCLWCLLKPEVWWQIRVVTSELLLSWNAVVGSQRPAGCRCLHPKGSADLAESLLTKKNRALVELGA